MLFAQLVIETGFTFEYLENLRLEQIGDLLSYMAAKNEAENGEY